MKRTPAERDVQLQVVFAFMIVYAALLFVVRPSPTAGQVAFRGAMALIGAAGLLWVARRRRRRR